MTSKAEKAKTQEQEKTAVSKDVAKAQKEISKIGHSSRYVKHYQAIAQALHNIEKVKGSIPYDEKKTSLENRTILARLVMKEGLTPNIKKEGTMRDVLRSYFNQHNNVNKVISNLTKVDTSKQVKSFLCISQHLHKRVLKEAKAQEK